MYWIGEERASKMNSEETIYPHWPNSDYLAEPSEGLLRTSHFTRTHIPLLMDWLEEVSRETT